jgi:hypothetical protein
MSTTTVFLCANATAGGNIARFRVAFGSKDDSRDATTQTSSPATEQVWSGLGCPLLWFWFNKGTGDSTRTPTEIFVDLRPALAIKLPTACANNAIRRDQCHFQPQGLGNTSEPTQDKIPGRYL